MSQKQPPDPFESQVDRGNRLEREIALDGQERADKALKDLQASIAADRDKSLKMLEAQFDKINAEHVEHLRKSDRQGFWMRMMLVLIVVSSVVVALWRIDS